MISRRTFVGAIPAAVGLGAAVRGSMRADPAAGELAVMTYNLRYASATPPNSWPQRRPVMRALIESRAPDVIGTQEGVYAQLSDLADDLPEYAWIGLGRDGGSRGEFMAVYYRRSRLRPLAYDHFWLSDTPSVMGSSTWGNSNRRMVTWVRFKDLLTGREFGFWNTHFDHEIQLAREKSAALVRERLADVDASLPVLLVGDFNAVATENPAYAMLAGPGGLADTWLQARERRNADVNTFNGFSPAVREGKRIDWILARGAWEVRASEIVTFQVGGQLPSDHFPVMSWVRQG